MKEVQHLKNNQDKQNQAMQALKSNINTFEKVNSTNCYKNKPKKNINERLRSFNPAMTETRDYLF